MLTARNILFPDSIGLESSRWTLFPYREGLRADNSDHHACLVMVLLLSKRRPLTLRFTVH